MCQALATGSNIFRFSKKKRKSMQLLLKNNFLVKTFSPLDEPNQRNKSTTMEAVPDTLEKAQATL